MIGVCTEVKRGYTAPVFRVHCASAAKVAEAILTWSSLLDQTANRLQGSEF